MAQQKENPAGKAGFSHERTESKSRCFGITAAPFAQAPFAAFGEAARALLMVETLSEKEGQFCGGLTYRSAPLSERQANWLRILLARHDLPALAEGGAHG